MSADSSFAVLIRRVRGGDAAAAEELVRQYEPAIRRSLRLRLDPRLRRTCDSMDLCQAVLCSFFVRAGCGEYELETPETTQVFRQAKGSLIATCWFFLETCPRQSRNPFAWLADAVHAHLNQMPAPSLLLVE